jgi:hypothetical protein
MSTSTAEKIETLVLSRQSGEYGEFVEYSPGFYRVTADGLLVLVRHSIHGWHVSFKGLEAIDHDLHYAAHMALNEGRKAGNAIAYPDLENFLKPWGGWNNGERQ